MRSLLRRARSTGARVPKASRLNLLLCGAQRGGTTALKYYLQEHPEIGFLDDDDLTLDGELVGFPFDKPLLIHSMRGREDGIYERLSRRLAGKVAYIATKQPYFMVYPHVPLNLAEQLPDARMIFTLRNPVECIYSTYWNGRRKGRRQDQSFGEFVDLAREQAADQGSIDRRSSWKKIFRDPDNPALILDRYVYYDQIRRFRALFPPEQIKVLCFDHFFADPKRHLREVLEFLGLDPGFEFRRAGEVKNRAPREQDMDERLRAQLRELYAEPNRRLFEMLGWDDVRWD